MEGFKIIAKQIETMLKNNKSKNIDDNIKLFNEVSKILKNFIGIDHPVLSIQLVKSENVHANDYNPNKVAPPEMKLLYLSIKEDGITQPIVGYQLEPDYYEVVDGFHRNSIIKEKEDIKKSTHGYMPIVLIDKEKDQRMASTIRHNRARGHHAIKGMSEIVFSLIQKGWDDLKIAKHLGMEAEEVIRLKQITGLKTAFANHEFSKSWEEFESKYDSKN